MKRPFCVSTAHPSWRMGTRRAALPFGRLTVPSEVEGHLDLFEQPGRKRVFQHPVKGRVGCRETGWDK